MEHYSILDWSPSPAMQPGAKPAGETDVQQPGTNRTSPGSVSAAIATANALAAAGGVSGQGAHAGLSFPGEDGGRSLAGMAQRDLDAALQLLAERAQYITGASGAAIALRRNQHNDMLCRASVGSNAPGLGALLSAESGLSGESVRTRSPLRCDDTERDPRVNRDGCRELGIASVVVMPIVRDDKVLGVFELFSGTASAFGERDLSALQRLGEMVDTAVKLAETAQGVVFEAPAEIAASGQPSMQESSDDEEVLMVNAGIEEVETEISQAEPKIEAGAADSARAPEVAATAAPVVAPTLPSAPKVTPSRKPMLWSVAADPASETDKTAPTADVSHVPLVLRNLHKCWACGFPVSEGRKLCVECEEKEWRGQLRINTPAAAGMVSSHQAFAAAAGAATRPRSESISSRQTTKAASGSLIGKVAVQTAAEAADASEVASDRSSDVPILSGGIGPSQSWLAANKYIIGAVLLAAGAVAAIVFLR